MTNILIAINENQTIFARELYEFLELNPTQYSRWAKSNIVHNQFAKENKDYFPFDMNGNRGGQATTNYQLSLDFAKKLCMISNSLKGVQVRNYFIEAERRYKEMMNQAHETPQMVKDYLALSEEEKAVAYFTKAKEAKVSIAISEEMQIKAVPTNATEKVYIEKFM